jgi:uncharacterized repeat protein (TIGR01451 family)
MTRKCFTQLIGIIVFWMIGLTTLASEKSNLELRMDVEKEVVVINKDGDKEIHREPAKEVIPGDKVIYTISYKNVGEEEADKIVIDNPIPENMEYVAGTAHGDGTEIFFSIDDGNTFDKPENLKVLDDDGNERVSTADEYTNIRWSLNDSAAPGATGQVYYHAELE